MNKRQKKKRMKKLSGYKEAEKIADQLLKALGMELGESRAKYMESVIAKEKGQV